MLRTDDLLGFIFTARKVAFENWNNSDSPGGPAIIDKNAAFVAEFRHALENRELTLYYQPKINLSSGAISGVEALARWHHPQYKLIYPADFIPQAELSGLTMLLNTWVLEEACRQMRLWRQNGAPIEHVSVNISGDCFKTPEFAEHVRGTLEKYNAEPHCFGIELSETAAIEDIGKICGVLNELLKIGVTISVDDVGADYASVSQLCNTPINIIKINSSFISGLPHDETAAVFVRTILDIAANSNIATLAEGVETKAQFNVLRNYGCNIAQGYLICPPLPVDRIEIFFTAYNQELKAAGIISDERVVSVKPQPHLAPSAEEILKSRLNQEKLINTIHAIILSDKDVSGAINKALRLLGQYFDVCSAYIAETDAGLKNCSITYEWVRPGQEPLAASLEKTVAGAPNYYALFRAGIFCVNDAAELSEPLASGYAEVGCRSFFQAVILVKGSIAGHIGFTKNTGKIWSDQEISLLKSTANIFSAALTRVHAEREITAHYKQMEMVLEHIAALITVIDAETSEVLFANEKFKQKFPLPVEKEPSRDNSCETGIYPLPSDKKLAVGETLTAEKYNDRLAVWLKITSTGITWLNSKPAVLQSVIDITAQKKQELLITEMAYEDTLTGLANRRAMEEYLDKKFAQFQENNVPVCIAMLDIDDFKLVNDTNGHDAGDAILKSTAKLLKTSIRSNDKACRWGGEEFVICFTHVDAPHALQVLERLRKKIEENKVMFGGKEHSITVSIGIAEFKPGENHYSSALYNADKAMYKSKAQGKNQVTYIDFYTEQI